MSPTNVNLNLNLLRLLQLASSTLPVGAYSYSEGLETLVQLNKINSVEGLEHWLRQELSYGAVRLEAAIMLRSYRSLSHLDTLTYWNHWLSATRDTEELRSQSWQMGRSLLQLFQNLQPDRIPHPLLADSCNFAVAFGIVAATWEIDPRSALLGYLHSWVTNIISAGIKLIPLGQTAGQKLLFNLAEVVDRSSQEILTIADDDLATCGWGLSLASMGHETLYSRLFRS
jgi:urease accessory protein